MTRTGTTLVFALLAAALGQASAEPTWILTYGRQYGRQMVSGTAGQAELFATNEDGSYARAGFTNEFNSSFAIFGYTRIPPEDVYTPGNLRVTFNTNVRSYDFQVFDPAAGTDRSVDCYWLDGLPDHGHYRFEFWFRKIADPSLYEFFPYQPAYHYDHVNGFNTATQQAPNYDSDAFDLSTWADAHYQTFVVPEGMNRIIGAKCFAIRQAGAKFRITLSIHEDGPTGAQVGPAVTTREINSNEFVNVKAGWGMEDVPVTSGRTYALKATWPGGFNMYATANDNYSQGMLYHDATPVPGRDMVAVVVGARRLLDPTPAASAHILLR